MEAPLKESPVGKEARGKGDTVGRGKSENKEDPASGYVPEIPAPPSVNKCSGHRCLRQRLAPWCAAAPWQGSACDAGDACCAEVRHSTGQLADANGIGCEGGGGGGGCEGRRGAGSPVVSASWQGPPSPIESLMGGGDAKDGKARREGRNGSSAKLGGRVGRALAKETRESQEEAVFRHRATDEREAFSHLAGGRYMCARLDKRCWLEVVDRQHRYAKNLRRYHYEWVRLGEPRGSFWRWLDGPFEDGECAVCLPTCGRERLEAERVRYCAPGDAAKYALTCINQRLFHLATEEHAEFAYRHDGHRDGHDDHHHAPGEPRSSRRRRDASVDRSRRGASSDRGGRHAGRPVESPPPGGVPPRGDSQKPRAGCFPVAAAAAGASGEPTEGERLAPEGHAPLTTGPKGWIFVLHDGSFYARRKGTSSGKQRFHHSSFFSGECVDAAGIIVARDGVVSRILPHSGHYRPREAHFARLLLYLRGVMKLDLDRVEVDVQRLLRVARPEHTKKMDTPHFWAASDALNFLTRKALAKSSNLLYAIENRGALESLRRRDLSLYVDLAETHRLPGRPILVKRNATTILDGALDHKQALELLTREEGSGPDDEAS